MKFFSLFRTPPAIVTGAYLVLIGAGTLLLLFVLRYEGYGPVSFVNALFTSASAVTVTGLTVMDTASLPFFAQIVILLLIQAGGIGIMTVFAFFLISLRRRKVGMGFYGAMKNVLDHDVISEVVHIVYFIVLFSLGVEFVGSVLFLPRFLEDMDFGRAVFFSIFHAVSAFCNAGFMLFSDGFIRFQQDAYINFVTASLIIIGGLGFTVFIALKTRVGEIIFRKRVKRKIDLTTKIILFSTALLVTLGTLALFLSEFNPSHPGDVKDALLVSFFQSVSARTAGFNTVEAADLTPASRFFLTTLMFIGAGPGSTSGGIKVTTFMVVFFGLLSFLGSQNEARIWGRTIELSNILKAFSIFVISLLIIAVFTALIVFVERIEPGKALFEVVSAFGTVGFSVGVAGSASGMGKIIFILTMFFGRLGPVLLFFLYSLRREQMLHKPKIGYPKERVVVG